MIRTLATALALASVLPTAAFAAAPDIRTEGPVIHLADNLDEKDNLGWCIDTLGRGRSDSLQAHSCKPGGSSGLDVTFTYEAASGQIRSAAYDDQCATLNPEGADPRFGLVDCDADDAAQAFDYDAETGRLSPRGQGEQCVVVGAASISAGPYMSRVLDLADCEATPAELRSWVVRP